MFGLRLPELLIILLVLVLLFGAKKLPALGDSLGKGIRAFKKAADHGFEEGAAGDTSKPPEGEGAKAPAGSATAAGKANRDGDQPV